MKKECHTAKSEQSSREGRRERCQKGSGFGWTGFLVGLGLGLIVGGILVFFLFEKTMRVVVEIEPKNLSDLTELDVIPSNSEAVVTREEMNGKFEQEIEKEGDLLGYKSTCLIEVKPMMQTGNPVARNMMITRSFMNTQMAIIMASSTLELAIDKIQLDSRWRKDRQSVLTILKNIIQVNQRRGTDLVEISVVHQNKAEAQMICEALYQAYAQRRNDLELGIRKNQLKAIKVELQNKSDRVAELRKRLMDIAEKSGIIYMETEQGDRTIGINSGIVEMAEKELYQAERDKEQLTFQINKLHSLDQEELVAVVAELPDVEFRKSYNKYVVAKRDLQKLLSGDLGKDHPDIAKRKTEIAKLEISLGKKAVSVRDSLKHKLALIEGRVVKMQEVMNAKKNEGTTTARDIQEFNVVRKEYQIALQIKDHMEVKYDLEKTKMILPSTNVILHDLSTTQEKVRLKRKTSDPPK